MIETNKTQTDLIDNRPKLETDRLILRPFVMEDEEAVFRICSEKEIAANTRTIPHPYPRDQAAHWIKQLPELWASGKSVVFAVCLKPTGNLVGAVGLEIHEKDQNAELGYWVDKQQWGLGIATEAAAAALAYGFEQLELHRVQAHYLATNPASGRVMEKIGMIKEGVMRQNCRKWGRFFDTVHYAALKSDFKSRAV